MKIISVIGPDQPEVIERVLRHLRLWPSGRFAARDACGPSPRRPPPDGRCRAVHAFLLTLVYALLLSVLYMTLRQPDYGQVKINMGLTWNR